jgi:adenylate cyclase
LDKLLDRPAIAVLPFENISGDPDQEYFADGLTEDIITALSLWKSFPVIARNSSFAFKGQSPDIRKVGEELGARYVIEGSVRKAGDRVRVTAQLIDAESGHHVWAERYDRVLSEIFALQDELTGRISAIVAPELERAENLRLKATDRQNLDAWDWVLRGLAHLNEFTAEGNAAARKIFERAAESDPAYSRAWSGIARSHFRDIVLGSTASIEDTLAQGFAMARKAVELDRSDSLAHEVLGIGHVLLGEFEPAISEAERAVELNPSNASAYSNLGYDLTVAGRPLEAIPQIERGLALNPKDQRIVHYFSFLALAHLGARQHDDAVVAARKAAQQRPDIPEPHFFLAAALGHLGELAEARASLKDCERIRPDYVAHMRGWLKFRQDADLEHLFEGLRKAGWEG